MTALIHDFPPIQTLAPARSRARIGWAAALLLLGVAVLLRSAQFDDPINGLDEQWYTLVGDRMWAGAVPYVDLWDRKPWGLFALFAAIRLLGAGMLPAKLVASLFAGTTAWIVARIAARNTGAVAALLGGAFYLLMLQQFWGGEPQSPVFYNLLLAGAVLLVIDADPALACPADRYRALAAMVLCGVAIQIKTNAVFEGGALGLWLVWRMVRAGAPTSRLAGMTLAMAALGLLPTAAVAGGYAAAGHFGEWWFANLQSQLLKRGTLGGAAMIRLSELVCAVAPLGLMAAIGARRSAGAGPRWAADRALLIGWAAVAAVDMVALGGFWVHYAIPFAVPGSILAANAFALARWGRTMFAIVSLYPAISAIVLDRISARDDAAIARATIAAIPPEVTRRCLFTYEGPVAYYQLTHACLVTRFAFTDHLRSSAEAGALGEDAGVALRAALARRPLAILTLAPSEWTERNRRNDATLAAALAAHYRRTVRLPHMHYLRGREWLIVWRRVD